MGFLASANEFVFDKSVMVVSKLSVMASGIDGLPTVTNDGDADIKKFGGFQSVWSLILTIFQVVSGLAFVVIAGYSIWHVIKAVMAEDKNVRGQEIKEAIKIIALAIVVILVIPIINWLKTVINV